MKLEFRKYLFSKSILVAGESQAPETAFQTVFSLAKLFAIKITKGMELATPDLIEICESCLGNEVPPPFYRGFPESVRMLTKNQLLFDQLLNYYLTYDCDDFDERRHSIFENDFSKLAFSGNVVPKNFVIVSEEEGVKLLKEIAINLLKSSRPLSKADIDVVVECIQNYEVKVESFNSKNTVIKILVSTLDSTYAKHLQLSDVIKVADQINYFYHGIDNVKKLKLTCKERKFITKVLDEILSRPNVDINVCYEKKRVWCGLLHNIHYEPKTELGNLFTCSMRSKGNNSVYSHFERAISEHRIKDAVDCLVKNKGTGALLRNLNYVLSKCETEDESNYIISLIKTDNNVLLLSLYLAYECYNDKGLRNFVFVKNNLLKVHTETEQERLSRTTYLKPELVNLLKNKIYSNLKENLANKLGKVYIDSSFKKIAVPMQDSTKSVGYGTLPTGSKIPIDLTAKIRAFTYWERVDDIDISCFLIDDFGVSEEFSWRTMAGNQSKFITYSGDLTSGYEGGSEYFDVDVTLLKKHYPYARYLVFANNVYSNKHFNNVYCMAGYMVRDKKETGKIFEPKTVKTSFKIDANNTFAYLYAIDLQTQELCWLNLARSGDVHVAGSTSFDFLADYLQLTEKFNAYQLFTMMATEVVNDVYEADVVVSDNDFDLREGVVTIKSCDSEKIVALLSK